jgi:Lrp/AsnC family leucine-responsive transcriptional regulator
MNLDNLDKKILAQLQSNSDISNLQLAEQVGLSAPACLKRVQKLKQSGIIEKQVAILSPDKLSPCLHMVVEVEMERDRFDLDQEFLKHAIAAPEVKHCYQVTGEVDFVLIVTVPDMPAYEAFCHRVLYKEKNLRKFRTLISITRHKFDTQVNLDNV